MSDPQTDLLRERCTLMLGVYLDFAQFLDTTLPKMTPLNQEVWAKVRAYVLQVCALLHQMVFETDETRPDTEQMLAGLPGTMEAVKAQILAELSAVPFNDVGGQNDGKVQRR